MTRCVIAVDQSTQGTKGLLFDECGILIARADRPHRQIITAEGWVEHDPEEIFQNTLTVCRDVVKKAGIDPSSIVSMGISNQRETSLMWDKATGTPIYHAIVWQCARASDICERPKIVGQKEYIQARTGLNLSPYFPAAKLCWMMENISQARLLASQGRLACGTVDSYLVYRLTGHHKTDFSNASRTQLFDITKLCWDRHLFNLFGVPANSLPEVCMSDSDFGSTDLCGFLPQPIPIHGVLGDSHAALFGQNCGVPGRVKATYGTGSSVMMHTGDTPRFSRSGLVTSLAWGMDGRVEYVLEGNLNYTGAVMTWLREQVGLIQTDVEASQLALTANPADRTYFVPAFTGLGAPYWDSRATGLLTGITRTTGQAEIAKACLDCIAYQITDLLEFMAVDSGLGIQCLRVDGGPTASQYLMQFQSDVAGTAVQVPALQELSGMGAAYAAGIAAGIYDKQTIFDHIQYQEYLPDMEPARREELYTGWMEAVGRALSPQGHDPIHQYMAWLDALEHKQLH